MHAWHVTTKKTDALNLTHHATNSTFHSEGDDARTNIHIFL
jgi:hypothetical protein